MNNDARWCKTLLCAYRRLGKFCDALNVAMDSFAMSGFMGNHMRVGVTTDMLYDKMIETADRKKGFINIRILVDNALKTLPDKYRSVLVSRYIHGNIAASSAEELGIPPRTYFRYSNKAVALMTFALRHIGYNSERLEAEYGGEPFIMGLYKSAEKNEESGTQS